MKKFSAMSPIGYAIIFVIILAVAMIASAPMLVNNVKNEKVPEPAKTYEEKDNSSELRRIEEYLSSRIDNLERRQENQRNQDTVSDKFICSIEGTLDNDGNVVPTTNIDKYDKIVFVCEYKR